MARRNDGNRAAPKRSRSLSIPTIDGNRQPAGGHRGQRFEVAQAARRHRRTGSVGRSAEAARSVRSADRRRGRVSAPAAGRAGFELPIYSTHSKTTRKLMKIADDKRIANGANVRAALQGIADCQTPIATAKKFGHRHRKDMAPPHAGESSGVAVTFFMAWFPTRFNAG